MATRRQEYTPEQHAKNTTSQAVNTAKQSTRSMGEFFKKFQNDWSPHLAQALAFSLITAIVPIAILLLAIVGNFLGALDPRAKGTFISHVTHAFPAQFSSQDVVNSAINKLSSSSGLLAFVAIVIALLFGSRLFTLMEVCFDVIYRLKPRPFVKKNLTALVMLILFIIFVPILVLASTVPGLATSIIQNTPINTGSDFLSRLGGILSSLIVSFLLFEAFYVFVPNRTENVPSIMNRLRSSWIGAAVGAVVLQIMLLFFPLYVQTFMKGYTGQIGLVLVVLAFFYLFAIIILLGAEINAYFSEGIRPTENDLITRASRSN